MLAEISALNSFTRKIIHRIVNKLTQTLLLFDQKREKERLNQDDECKI
jgi:hypothetical protein